MQTLDSLYEQAHVAFSEDDAPKFCFVRNKILALEKTGRVPLTGLHSFDVPKEIANPVVKRSVWEKTKHLLADCYSENIVGEGELVCLTATSGKAKARWGKILSDISLEYERQAPLVRPRTEPHKMPIPSVKIPLDPFMKRIHAFFKRKYGVERRDRDALLRPPIIPPTDKHVRLRADVAMPEYNKEQVAKAIDIENSAIEQFNEIAVLGWDLLNFLGPAVRDDEKVLLHQHMQTIIDCGKMCSGGVGASNETGAAAILAGGAQRQFFSVFEDIMDRLPYAKKFGNPFRITREAQMRVSAEIYIDQMMDSEGFVRHLTEFYVRQFVLAETEERALRYFEYVMTHFHDAGGSRKNFDRIANREKTFLREYIDTKEMTEMDATLTKQLVETMFCVLRERLNEEDSTFIQAGPIGPRGEGAKRPVQERKKSFFLDPDFDPDMKAQVEQTQMPAEFVFDKIKKLLPGTRQCMMIGSIVATVVSVLSGTALVPDLNLTTGIVKDLWGEDPATLDIYQRVMKDSHDYHSHQEIAIDSGFMPPFFDPVYAASVVELDVVSERFKSIEETARLRYEQALMRLNQLENAQFLRSLSTDEEEEVRVLNNQVKSFSLKMTADFSLVGSHDKAANLMTIMRSAFNKIMVSVALETGRNDWIGVIESKIEVNGVAMRGFFDIFASLVKRSIVRGSSLEEVEQEAKDRIKLFISEAVSRMMSMSNDDPLFKVMSRNFKSQEPEFKRVKNYVASVSKEAFNQIDKMAISIREYVKEVRSDLPNQEAYLYLLDQRERLVRYDASEFTVAFTETKESFRKWNETAGMTRAANELLLAADSQGTSPSDVQKKAALYMGGTQLRNRKSGMTLWNQAINFFKAKIDAPVIFDSLYFDKLVSVLSGSEGLKMMLDAASLYVNNVHMVFSNTINMDRIYYNFYEAGYIWVMAILAHTAFNALADAVDYSIVGGKELTRRIGERMIAFRLYLSKEAKRSDPMLRMFYSGLERGLIPFVKLSGVVHSLFVQLDARYARNTARFFSLLVNGCSCTTIFLASFFASGNFLILSGSAAATVYQSVRYATSSVAGKLITGGALFWYQQQAFEALGALLTVGSVVGTLMWGVLPRYYNSIKQNRDAVETSPDEKWWYIFLEAAFTPFVTGIFYRTPLWNRHVTRPYEVIFNYDPKKPIEEAPRGNALVGAVVNTFVGAGMILVMSHGVPWFTSNIFSSTSMLERAGAITDPLDRRRAFEIITPQDLTEHEYAVFFGGGLTKSLDMPLEAQTGDLDDYMNMFFSSTVASEAQQTLILVEDMLKSYELSVPLDEKALEIFTSYYESTSYYSAEGTVITIPQSPIYRIENFYNPAMAAWTAASTILDYINSK